MPSRDDMFIGLWQLWTDSVGRPPLPFHKEHAIPKAWCERYAEWGSPWSDDVEIGGGWHMQGFTRALVGWHPDVGITVETGLD
jgi:hypothetical protein